MSGHWAFYVPRFISNHDCRLEKGSFEKTCFKVFGRKKMHLMKMSWICFSAFSYAPLDIPLQISIKPQKKFSPSRPMPTDRVTSAIRLLISYPAWCNGPENISLRPHAYETTILKPRPFVHFPRKSLVFCTCHIRRIVIMHRKSTRC